MENCMQVKKIVNISINTDCNGNCPYCFQQNYHGQNKYMELEEFNKILDWCNGAKTVRLLGGEPTLHPKLLDFIKELEHRNIQPVLLTNAATSNSNLWNSLSMHNLQYLVNCNHASDLDVIFLENLKLISTKQLYCEGIVTLGITLIGNKDYDEKSVKYLAYLINYFSNIPFEIRIGLATPYADYFSINDYSRIINKIIDIIEVSVCTMKFDCQINCCNLDYKTMGRILYSNKISDPNMSRCENPICAIRMDGSVLYCDSLDDVYVDHYYDFSDINECEMVLKKQMDKLLKDISIDHLCNNGALCSNPICPGPCPAILNKLYKQSLEVKNE